MNIYENFTPAEANGLTLDALMAMPWEDVPTCRRREVRYEFYARTVRAGVPPELVTDSGFAREAALGTRISGSIKSGSSGRVEGVFLLSDGHVAEVLRDEYGGSRMWAFVHASREAYRAYNRPLSMNEYFNG